MKNIENMIKEISLKKLNIVNTCRLFGIFSKLNKDDSVKYMKIFIKEYFLIEEDMPEDFYELLINKIDNNEYFALFKVLEKRDIYLLINYLRDSDEDVSKLYDVITPLQYYSIKKRDIKRIVDKLKILDNKLEDNKLDSFLENEGLWLLKRNPSRDDSEYEDVAYKIYLSIGFDNAMELLDGKYGVIDYEKGYYLFSRLNVKKGLEKRYQEYFLKFLFGNKKDYNNVVRQMLRGDFIELFLNFDYFYNNYDYFVDRLGIKMTKEKIGQLINDRFLTHSVVLPQITGDIYKDMLSSYYCKYDFLDVSEEEIYSKNMDIYNKYLRNKYQSSIPKINIIEIDGFKCEVLDLRDPRNLVMGYRSGNCFRINGEAGTLFNNFLKSEHMRLVSISTLEYKDYAMMLVMRNGNVLVSQGIEVSKYVSSDVKGEKLYNVCRIVLKEMMDYMNACGDLIVATIIGSSNENVSLYNKQILPFIVNPILDNKGNYYNGIYNYQCLLDLDDGKSLNDIKLGIPSKRYLDNREEILRRNRGMYDEKYREIEKRLIALRYLRINQEGNYDFYETLFNHKEIYICCNIDWYIILFDNYEIDSFLVNNGDERAICEYNRELQEVYNFCNKSNRKIRRK